MRTGLLAAALAVLLAPGLAPAADPAVVYQTQPLGRLLDDLRTTIQQVGGDEAVKQFNDGIKRSLGDKGFDGFDLNRPIVGYIDVPADPTDTIAVIAFPVTGEKEWLDFVQRWNKAKPKALKDGVYEVPPPGPNFKAAMRVSEGYAYVATGMKDPARVLDPKALVPFGKMYDPTDVSLMAGRVYFDRLPKEVRAKAKEGLEQLKKGPTGGGFGLGPIEAKLFVDPFLGLVSRWLELSEGAKEAALRVNADALSGEMVAELTVTPIPGSRLEKAIAGIKPATNRFAALVTPDSVGGLKVRLPLDIPEVKDGLVNGLESIQKLAANNAFPPMKATIDELLKGLIRTAKTGEMDAAAALRGPDQNGTFTGVGAIAFDDPSGFEKELKKFVTGIAPQEVQDAIKWDAEKVNGVGIHTIDMSKNPGDGREVRALFGQNMTIAYAFAPKAIYAAIGPGDAAVKAIKEAMAVKPVEAPTIEFAFNADRVVKLVGTVEPQAGARVQKMLGKADKLVPAWSVSAAGGKELKLRYAMNAKLFAALFWTRGAAASAPPVPPPAK